MLGFGNKPVKKSLGDILGTFNQVTNDLKEFVSSHTAEKEQLTVQKQTIEERMGVIDVEVERASSVQAKIEELIK